MRILLAEDDAFSRRFLGKSLNSWGYEVVLAADGQEAWEILQEDEDLVLVLLDWNMPVMGGIELCQKVRAEMSDRWLYLVMLTASDQTRHLVEAIEAGADDFVKKTDNIRGLQARLSIASRIIESRGGNVELEQPVGQAQPAGAGEDVAGLAKGEFLTNLSHEIRTPITAVLGYADLLVSPDLGSDERLNYVSGIRRNGERLLDLINDFLDLAMIEGGSMEVTLASCDVVGLVADLVKTATTSAESQQNELHVEFATKMPETIHSDLNRLRQALANLVDNAVKFTENGAVRIVASFLPDWRDGVSAVQFDVVDTGIGIEQSKLQSLFQPFVQADSSASRKYGGTGMGLAITRHIAELLGGDIAVQSKRNQGSTFSLIVPTGDLDGVTFVQPEGDLSDWEARLQAVDLDGLRVLLAEDGYDNQLLLRKLLGRAGATVDLAENGKEAVAKATANTYDVVLMDMQMPEMDGYTAAAVLRQRGYDVPILALTAHSMDGDRDKCLRAGCDDYLTKPINREVLLREVGRHAGRKVVDQADTPPTAPAVVVAAPAPQSSEPKAIPGEGDILHSEYADDSDMVELIEDFVGRLDEIAESMNQAFQAGDFDGLRTQAHQMKGAGGLYGYPTLSTTAGTLEQAAKSADAEAAMQSLSRLCKLFQAVARGWQRQLS